MPELVRRLSLLLDRSVIDKTGFTGLFDLQLDFVPDETTPAMPRRTAIRELIHRVSGLLETP